MYQFWHYDANSENGYYRRFARLTQALAAARTEAAKKQEPIIIETPAGTCCRVRPDGAVEQEN